MRQRMSNVDAAWLDMERPENLMLITGVLELDDRVDIETLREVVGERLVERFPRLRHRVARSSFPLTGAWWVDDEDFSVDHHVVEERLPAPGGQDGLAALVSAKMSAPLDLSQPLWQLTVVDRDGGGSAVVARFHHTVADGISVTRMLLSLLDAGPSVEEDDPAAERGRIRGAVARRSEKLAAITDSAASAVSATRRATEGAFELGSEVLARPSRLLELARVTGRSAATLSELITMDEEIDNPFRGELGVAKRAAWGTSADLDDVKAIARANGTDVNAVLLAALTGALRRELELRGETPVDLRALVPFSVRALDAPVPRSLGNRFGVVFMDLPVASDSPAERLRVAAERMQEFRESPQTALVYGLVGALGLSPKQIAGSLVDLFARRASAVITNMPGPSTQLSLAGAPVDRMMFWTTQAGGLGLGVSVLTYAGQVTVGVAGDAGLVPDPQRMTAAFRDELEALAGASDGGTTGEPGRCAGSTSSGRRCRNTAQPGSQYCHVHDPAA